MQLADRMQGLTTAIFSKMDSIKMEVEQAGLKVINLGIGSPDQPPPAHVVDALTNGVIDLQNYSYPTSEGTLELRAAVAKWYQLRFGVDLDPNHEVLVLMGSQDGLAHLAQAFVNPGDLALIPDPGYPIYSGSIVLAGGEVYPMPLRAEKDFLPDLENIPEAVGRKAKLMVLNYPNNPVAAVANPEFFSRVVAFAQKYEVIICHDAAYSELAFDGYQPPSFLQTPHAIDVGVEFHSVSKSYNMAGCRLGFVVGNRSVIGALAKIKSNIDYGVFLPIQRAGIAALDGPQEITKENAERYQKRRDFLVQGLAKLGWHIPKPLGSMFLWAPLPFGFANSLEFAEVLLRETGVLVIPGIAFGQEGEGYVRIALTQDLPALQQVIDRIAERFAR